MNKVTNNKWICNISGSATVYIVNETKLLMWLKERPSSRFFPWLCCLQQNLKILSPHPQKDQKKRISSVALYYTRWPKRCSVIFQINFLAASMAAYFLNFVYGQVLSSQTSSRLEHVEISFGFELMSCRNLLFLLLELVFFLSSTQTLVHDLTYFHLSDPIQIWHTALL